VLRATLKNLLARRFRLVTSGFAVLLGVAFMAGTLVLTDTVTNTFGNLFSDVFRGTDAFVRAVQPFDDGDDGANGNSRPAIDDSVVARVRAVPGVDSAQPSVFGFAQSVDKKGDAIGKPGQGPPTFGSNWIDDPRLSAYHLIAGRAPRSDGEVAIDNHTAKEGPFRVGDPITVLTKAGALHLRVAGITKFGKYDSAGGSTQVAFTLRAAQRYVAEPGKVNGVSVVASPGISQAEVRQRIDRALPSRLEVITGKKLTEENKDQIGQFIGILRNAMLAFALIALFVGSFIIYNTFSILVAQRTREMALLRAIGASRRQVTTSVVVEAFAIGLIASVLGLFAGFGVAAGLKALLGAFGGDLPANGLRLTPPAAFWSILTGTLVSVFAAWFPARRGAKVPPIAAMRDVAIEHEGRPRLRVALGSLLLVIGMYLVLTGPGSGDGALQKVGFGALLTLLGVTSLGPLVARPVSGLLGRPVARLRGTAGSLARENAMRNPKRTSTTAAALMIGVALISFITIFASSAKASVDDVFSKQFTGDFVMNTNAFGFGGVSIDMAKQLKEVPGVAAVSPLRIARAKFDGKVVQLQGIDASEMQQIADIGIVQGSVDDLGRDGLAVLDDKAKDEGWKIGTKVPVQFTDTGRSELTVRVIYRNQQLAGRYFVDTAVMDANVHEQFDAIVFAKLAPGHSVAEVRPAIERVTKAYANVEVQDRKEFIDAQAGQINQALALIVVLLFVAVIIALFGIANTLALSIVERTRELGLLRAVGMTRRQLKSMVRWEAVLISLFGTAGGLGVGVFFGWSMVRALHDQGFTVFRVPLVTLVFIAALAAFFGVLAAVVPARRAAKLDVLRAIAHA
jgi:putative ABC transport system permease protein